MSEQRLRDLLELDLDGVATPAERTELQQQLEREPELRRSRDAMQVVHQLLDERPHVDPPESLREQIAESVRKAAEERDSARFAFNPGRGRRVRRLGLAVAAVLTLAILLGPSLTRNLDFDQLRGTMSPGATSDAGWNLIPLDGEEIRGAVLTQSTSQELIVRIELESPRSERLEVIFEADELKLSSISGAVRFSVAEPGRVVASLEGRPPELRFERLTDDPVALSLSISDRSAATSLEIAFP